MAKVRLNPVLEQIRGQVGELVFNHYGNEVIVSRKTDLEGVVPSEAQAAHRERFQQAVQYGKAAMADPVEKGLYQAAAKARGIPPFSCAVADFFHAPGVGELELSNYTGSAGDKITFRAVDDFGVVSAVVTITKKVGTGMESVIESGGASETAPGSGSWSYTATQTVPTGTHVCVTATATDRPGGVGTGQAEKDL